MSLKAAAKAMFQSVKAIKQEMTNVETQIEACIAAMEAIEANLDWNDPDALNAAKEELGAKLAEATRLYKLYRDLENARVSLNATAEGLLQSAQALLTQ